MRLGHTMVVMDNLLSNGGGKREEMVDTKVAAILYTLGQGWIVRWS